MDTNPFAHSPLHLAVGEKDIPTIRSILLRGEEDVNGKVSTTEGKETPLILAVLGGNVMVCDELLKHGADPNIPSEDGCTPLHWAAMRGNLGACVLLLEAGANADLVKKGEKLTPLHYAAFQGEHKIVECLLHFNANRLIPNSEGYIALHLGVSRGCEKTVEALMKEKVMPQLEYSAQNGYIPMDFAKRNENQKIINLLKHLEEQQLKKDKQLPPWIQKAIAFTLPFYCFPGLWMYIITVPLILVAISFLFLREFLRRVIARETPDLFMGQILSGIFQSLFFWSTFVWFSWVGEVQSPLEFYGHTIASSILIILYFYLRDFSDPGTVKPALIQFFRYCQEKGESDNSRFCDTCVAFRPIRSKHCSDCGVCVYRRDHHCYFIHKCIGAGNHKTFFVFHILHVFCQYFFIHFLYVYIIFLAGEEGGEFEARNMEDSWFWELVYEGGRRCPGTTGVLVFHLIMGTFLTLQLITSIFCLFYNLTTVEMIKRKNYFHFLDKDLNYSNPFNRGMLLNLYEFLFEPIPLKQKRWEEAVKNRLEETKEIYEEEKRKTEQKALKRLQEEQQQQDFLQKLYGAQQAEFEGGGGGGAGEERWEGGEEGSWRGGGEGGWQEGGREVWVGGGGGREEDIWTPTGENKV